MKKRDRVVAFVRPGDAVVVVSDSPAYQRIMSGKYAGVAVSVLSSEKATVAENSFLQKAGGGASVHGRVIVHE